MKVAGDGPIEDKARSLLASIRHEITIMSQLDYPHIVKLLGIDSSYTRGPAMIFELCSGITLNKFLDQSPLDFRDGFKLIKCLTLALGYLHEHKSGAIAHGDIQPANIYVLPDGQAKLTNFTCAFQYVSGEPTIGKPLSSTISTPLLPSLYFEPQCYNKKPQDRLHLPTTAGDIWSLGSIILSMFASTFRYQGPEIYSAQIHQGVSPCDMHRLSLGDDRVPSLVRSMLAYEGSERPTARGVLNSLLSIE
ncbi:kinase-like domain-containing protein [Rhizoctonia solani]|nr:kinase-like domain-containing protein [Rhizoctonia solani]